jgi:hypothetical protein
MSISKASRPALAAIAILVATTAHARDDDYLDPITALEISGASAGDGGIVHVNKTSNGYTVRKNGKSTIINYTDLTSDDDAIDHAYGATKAPKKNWRQDNADWEMERIKSAEKRDRRNRQDYESRSEDAQQRISDAMADADAAKRAEEVRKAKEIYKGIQKTKKPR